MVKFNFKKTVNKLKKIKNVSNAIILSLLNVVYCLFHCCEKYLKLFKRRFSLAHGVRLQSMMAGTAWWQE